MNLLFQKQKKKTDATKKIKNKDKHSFYITREEATLFEFRDSYYISEIRTELNRIFNSKMIRRVTLVEIWKFLFDKGYLEERIINNEPAKYPTALGIERGITIIEQTSASGTPYNLIRYPREIQKEIVESFIK